MAPQNSALSQTLESLTRSKIRELEKQRSTYEARKASILTEADDQLDLFSRVRVILTGTKAIHPTASRDTTVGNIERWLDQHRFDPSITDGMLREYEIDLRARLDAHSRKLSLADLYSRLLTEWTNAGEVGGGDGVIDEEEYAVIDERQKQRLQQLVDQFEETVFTPLETSAEEIHAFFDELFPGDEELKQLQALRERIEENSRDIFETDAPFDRESLTATIKGLLTEDILSEEKQGVLKDFLKNDVALTEIADVLNMRWADLENWDWFAEDEGIPVLPRQQLNGKYRIWMDEDVLQLIFVQYIGLRLCNLLKNQLKDFILSDGVWNWAVAPPFTEHDKERQIYYLDRLSRGGPENARKSDYLEGYFLCQLPLELTTLADGGAPYDDESEDGQESEDIWRTKSEVIKNPKQHLLRKVATETLIQRHIYDEAAVVQSDLRWYATGLPHSTIFAVMEYIGLSEKWIVFFRKYLESPLNLDSSSEGRMPMGPRTRKRGVPMAHSSEKLIGEMILFFMDLAVNRTTGLLLYRLHDDLWLCGEPSKCAHAWEVMGKFAKVTGLEFNMSKTGSVCLSDLPDPVVEGRLPNGPVTFGFLKLDPSGTWIIDQTQVDAHVKQLKTQLDKCDSVMAWIRTWNSCIGRFFKNTFGQPAVCFGQGHVDMILSTYRAMQETLFGDTGTVTQHLRQMIKNRFGVSDIPDALFYYPEELGGLGLRNPSISPFLVRDALHTSPLQRILDFSANEVKLYNSLKKEFDELPQTTRMTRFAHANNGMERRFVPRAERDTFMSFEEWSRFRWSQSTLFRTLYQDLQEVPEPDGIDFTMEMSNALFVALNSGQVRALDQEVRWILQMYAPEVLRDYGGAALVDRKYLPVGVMAMVKERRVKWQMVL
ncbi:uncharacterized protein DSM5745_08661 [Aspergillus mulundensis]|uniref:Reverse transcriptase domain-containing protein n=1 Tax=Aspergillus mulundensis TaxID=1810919 RepID=A0A3D8R4P6_9EURO|nr:Uncharacterized protein DSM5745_08661 [Aspergillus mulundensis]RDW68901.1 Uncharacterized protein DSM5745_08661 [Aspergillus mulundensis]